MQLRAQKISKYAYILFDMSMLFSSHLGQTMKSHLCWLCQSVLYISALPVVHTRYDLHETRSFGTEHEITFAKSIDAIIGQLHVKELFQR